MKIRGGLTMSRRAGAGESGLMSLCSRCHPLAVAVLALAGVFAKTVDANTDATRTAVATNAAVVESPAPFVRDGKAGFVVSHIKYALADGSPDLAVACPDGMSLQVEEIFAMTREGKRKPGESDADYAKRLQAGGRALSTGPTGEDLCMNPEMAGPDTHYRTLKVDDIPVFGIDLDGQATTASAKPASCAQVDLPSAKGEQGIDNQFYRLVGCSRSFQPDGQSNGFEIEMHTGSWGILLTLGDIDDLRNDDHVDVGIYANADPVQLSPARAPLAYATYAMDPDPRFRATTTGRIENGVLTTAPVDVRFHHVVNSIRLERPLKDARLQLRLSEDGTLDGYLAGYTPVEDLYDYQYGFRNGQGGDGKPAPLPLRSGSANGAARVLGHTCAGVYQAMHELADGHPDAQSGKCTSISTQYQVQALPAFVVDVASASKNQGLKEKSGFGDED